MRLLFFVAGIFCSVLALMVWFFPDVLIRINDWFTEKTLLHEKIGIYYRIVLGSFYVAIAVIFFWSIFG
jgi:hypothetical protein